MSVIVIKNKWDGGVAEDIRTENTNEHSECLNFDTYTNPNKLIPLRDSIEETIVSVGTMDEIEISDVGICVLTTNPVLVALGRESPSSNAPAFYTRTGGAGMNGSWTQQAVGSSGTVQKGTLITYKGLAFCINKTAATTYTVERFNSGGSVTVVGTITTPTATGSAASGFQTPRPFIHPEDNVLYITIGNVISKWDGSSFTNYTSILPSGMEATSLTNYGSYLVISMRPINSLSHSVAYLWGRDGTINTLQGTIDFGEGDLNIIENVNNVLVGVVYPKVYDSSIINSRIDIRVYSGGVVETVKSINDPNLTIAGNTVNILKLKVADKLYFGTGYTETAIRCFYKNKAGRWVLTKERYYANGDTPTVLTVSGLNAIGDYFYLGFTENGGEYKFTATLNSATYSSVSIYKTTINPNMPIADRYTHKQLESVQVSFTGKTGGTIQIKYSVDGSAMSALIPSGSGGTTTTAIEDIREITNEDDGVSFSSGREISFQIESTGGVEIKELKYKYKVLNSLI